MKATRCNRSGSGRGRTRPSSCNRPRWPRSPSPPPPDQPLPAAATALAGHPGRCAQLEATDAGEAHAGDLAGVLTVDETYDRFRRHLDVTTANGFGVPFSGDDRGAARAARRAPLRQLAQGRRRALRISKSDKLIEDAERDWIAIGGYRSDIVPLSRFRQGAAIALGEAYLFTTHATLRTQARGEKPSRVQQIIDWLGRDPGSGPGNRLRLAGRGRF